MKTLIIILNFVKNEDTINHGALGTSLGHLCPRPVVVYKTTCPPERKKNQIKIFLLLWIGIITDLPICLC